MAEAADVKPKVKPEGGGAGGAEVSNDFAFTFHPLI